MSSKIRPDFEVVREGWILNFDSGYRRIAVNDWIIQGVAGSSPALISWTKPEVPDIFLHTPVED
jgi:hypothetical protein